MDEPKVDLNDRESIIQWLCWNDHNGCFRDQDCDDEGLDRLTLETAREVYNDMNNPER